LKIGHQKKNLFKNKKFARKNKVVTKLGSRGEVEEVHGGNLN
jgi:hypothetical protein